MFEYAHVVVVEHQRSGQNAQKTEGVRKQLRKRRLLPVKTCLYVSSCENTYLYVSCYENTYLYVSSRENIYLYISSCENMFV